MAGRRRGRSWGPGRRGNMVTSVMPVVIRIGRRRCGQAVAMASSRGTPRSRYFMTMSISNTAVVMSMPGQNDNAQDGDRRERLVRQPERGKDARQLQWQRGDHLQGLQESPELHHQHQVHQAQRQRQTAEHAGRKRPSSPSYRRVPPSRSRAGSSSGGCPTSGCPRRCSPPDSSPHPWRADDSSG